MLVSRSVPDPSLSRRLLPHAGWMAREAAKLCLFTGRGLLAWTPLVRVALYVSFLRLRDEGRGSPAAAPALSGRNFQQVWSSSCGMPIFFEMPHSKK